MAPKTVKTQFDREIGIPRNSYFACPSIRTCPYGGSLSDPTPIVAFIIEDRPRKLIYGCTHDKDRKCETPQQVAYDNFSKNSD